MFSQQFGQKKATKSTVAVYWPGPAVHSEVCRVRRFAA